ISTLFAVTYCGGILNNTHALGHLNVSHWRCQDRILGNSKHRDVRVGWRHRVAGSTLTLYLETPGLYFICGHSAYKALPPGWWGRCGVARVIPDVQINKTLDSSQILNLGRYSHRLFKPPIR
ncbi:endogenous retrovirus group MER34 member 1, partial [Chelydra serpentina]